MNKRIIIASTGTVLFLMAVMIVVKAICIKRGNSG